MSSFLTLLWGSDYPAVITARLMAGIAHGIVYVILIGHAGELSMADCRARMMATINAMLLLGCALFVICHYVNIDCEKFYIDRLYSMIALVLSITAILAGAYLTLESPSFLIRAHNERKAMSIMMKLRNEISESQQMHIDFEDIQSMVAEDFIVTQNIYTDLYRPPLLLALGFRLLGVLVNNWILNIIQIKLIEEILVLRNSQISTLILILARLFASVIVIVVSGLATRRLLLQVSLGLTIISLCISAVLMLVGSYYSKYVLLALIFAHQMTVGGIESGQHVIVAEAFGLKKKALSITFVACTEYLIHIAVIAIFYNIGAPHEVRYGVTFATTGILVLIGSILHFSMPETYGMTLRKARETFRKST